jgi:ABC-2 type transport system permease protein
MNADARAKPRPRLKAKPKPRPVHEPALPSVETARLRDTLPGAGWRVVATKEFGDHLLSARFTVLLIILGFAATIPLYFASDQIRALAPQATGVPAIFLALFTVGSPDIGILRVDFFVGLVAPLLGLAFAFDAVNGERSEGTLPRLLAQPIYRDDVINGKFAAGMASIGTVLACVVTIIAAFGIVRLGIVPHGEEILRLIAWLLATFLYVGIWLAFGLLLSVVIRRAATAALVGFGVWFLVAVLGDFFARLLTGLVTPTTATFDAAVAAAQLQQLIVRLFPGQLYAEITKVILDPTTNARDVILPSTIGQAEQASQQISAVLPLAQSLLLVWPQIVVMFALMIICFVGAYVAFMRQEVRA